MRLCGTSWRSTVTAFFAVILVFQGVPTALADGSRTFTYKYDVEVGPVPEGEGPVEVFIPIARADSHQEILSREVTASIPGEVKAEDQYGNLFWRGRVEKSDGKPIHVSATYAVRRHVFKNELIGKVKRTEMTVREKVDHALFLGPNERVPVSGELVTRMAKEIAPGETNPAVVARAIFVYVVDTMEYKKGGKGWGNGDTHWACSERYGNCTDFHALFISLARVRGIPAKFAIGSAVPEGKSQG